MICAYNVESKNIYTNGWYTAFDPRPIPQVLIVAAYITNMFEFCTVWYKRTKLLANKTNNGIHSPYFISIISMIYRFFRWSSLIFVSRCIAFNDSTINAQTTNISDYVIYRFCGFRENIVPLFYFRYPVSPELLSQSDLFHS